ncbi:MAG TPA: sigma-70 factor domain-containing protein, partial [Opitutales bacterium]|nr:sigma-70 factor domain-containing protein [Opitutales bacterium]
MTKKAKTAPAQPKAKATPTPDVPEVIQVHREEFEAAGGNPALTERIRLLIQLSKEQGYLSTQDINNILPEFVNSPEEIENVLNILDNLEIEIMDEDELKEHKQKSEEAEEIELQNAQSDILDDPVRMYLKQMGQVPLLTREQEVEISKRIENAEQKAQEEFFRLGISADHVLDLARKLWNREERFDRLVSDKKIDNREGYFKLLAKAIEQAEELHKDLLKQWDTSKKETASDNVKKKALERYHARQEELIPVF